MLIKTRGIIFKALKYSETSLIMDIYTEEKGLQKYIVSGVRSKGAKMKMGILQPTTLVEMVAYSRDTKNMHRIKEIKAAHIYQSLPFDVLKGTIGLFMVELAQKTIKEQEANPDLFEFLYGQFVALDQAATLPSNFHLSFMLILTEYLGFSPNGSWSRNTPYFDMKSGNFVELEPLHQYAPSKTASENISLFLEGKEPNITRKERQQLLENCIIYYRLHVENFMGLNTHTILKEVLE